MKQARKQLYEGMYILSSTLTEENKQKVLDKITHAIVAKGGEIHKMFDQGRKKLAYEVGKKKEGHYFLFYFSVPTPAVKELWKEYNLNEDLIRFLTLAVEEVPEKIIFKPLPE